MTHQTRIPTLTVLLLALALVAGGCKEGERAETDAAPAAEQAAPAATAETPAPAAEPATEPATPAASADLASYPMPEEVPGEDLIIGDIVARPLPAELPGGPRAGLKPGEEGPQFVVRGLRINCCTEKLRAGVVIDGDRADVSLWEYLPDVCECFTPSEVRLPLAQMAGVTEYRVFQNGREEPVAVYRMGS